MPTPSGMAIRSSAAGPSTRLKLAEATGCLSLTKANKCTTRLPDPCVKIARSRCCPELTGCSKTKRARFPWAMAVPSPESSLVTATTVSSTVRTSPSTYCVAQPASRLKMPTAAIVARMRLQKCKNTAGYQLGYLVTPAGIDRAIGSHQCRPEAAKIIWQHGKRHQRGGHVSI